MRHVIVTGNPIDGLYFYGPYMTAQEAADDCERHLHGNNAGEYWIATLAPPIGATERATERKHTRKDR